MQNKGTILIVDDRLQEKIGKFKDYLEEDGYVVQIAETLEKADECLSELISKNSLDGIILDFSFPVNEKDPSVQSKGKPNGVVLYEKFSFKIRTQGIPIVINTTGDEEYKRKYMGDIENLGTPVYNVNHEANPLAQASPDLVNDILEMFNERNDKRVSTCNIQPDKKWLKKGGPFLRDEKGNIIGYR